MHETHEEIFCLAAAIARPTEEERPLLEALCTSAGAETARRLREGVTPESCGEPFLCAAALLAAAGLLPCRDLDGAVQFSAGDVSLKTGGSLCETAAALRRQAAAIMAPFWGDGEFAFVGVRG